MGVRLSDVKATGVQTFDGNQVTTWTKDSANIPADIQILLNASFDLDTHPGSGTTTATMAENISNQSVFASIFCNNINVFNTDNPSEVILQGDPQRFGALIYSPWRVYNWEPPMAGSARFCSAIPMEKLNSFDQPALLQLFEASKSYDSRTLKGLFITYSVLEVFENRFDPQHYLKNGTAANPATCTTVVTIAPWYEGDMKTGILGRELTAQGMESIYTGNIEGTDIPIFFTPPITSLRKLEENKAIFSIDMGNTWPESVTKLKDPPEHRGDAIFETLSLGVLSLRYATDKSTEFAKLEINPQQNPRTTVFQQGCIFDFILEDPIQISMIEGNLIQGFLEKIGGTVLHALRETEYMMSSDQKGLYADEGDDPRGGYWVDDDQRVPSKVRILQKGKPVTQPIWVAIANYPSPQAGNDPFPPGTPTVRWVCLSDNDVVPLLTGPLNINNTGIYYLAYSGQYPNNQIPDYTNSSGSYTIMDTGSFFSLRVHPSKDYSLYLDSNNWGTTPPSFEVVYKEVFELYDVVYPAMSLVHPFTREIWNNGTMAGLVLQRTDPALFSNVLYMPKSRELSTAQRQLLQAWAAYLNQINNDNA
jgi:hypothetical protein